MVAAGRIWVERDSACFRRQWQGGPGLAVMRHWVCNSADGGRSRLSIAVIVVTVRLCGHVRSGPGALRCCRSLQRACGVDGKRYHDLGLALAIVSLV